MMHDIKEYGETVSIKNYTDWLQWHAYIPQSDECIAQIIENFQFWWDILDLWCWPWRLTLPIAQRNKKRKFIGIDQSASFLWNLDKNSPLENAQFRIGSFEEINLGESEWIYESQFGIIFMQWVLHHLHGDTRKIWFQKIFKLLQNDWILVIWDEYIPEFLNEDDRRNKLSLFYAHIIWEARNGGFEILAEEEAKNLIDDITGWEEGAGIGTPKFLQEIITRSSEVNRLIFLNKEEALKKAVELKNHILEITKKLSLQEHMPNFYRGDFKVSIQKNIEEIENFGFKKQKIYTFWPVDTVGGMGVIVFWK